VLDFLEARAGIEPTYTALQVVPPIYKSSAYALCHPKSALSRHDPARSPIRIDLIQQPAYFGVALLDQASSFDNQADTLAEKSGEIERGISVMLGGSGVSLTGGAMTGGGELCAQPADKVSVIATSACEASRFKGEGMLCVLLLG
jgi:hypothetical protein